MSWRLTKTDYSNSPQARQQQVLMPETQKLSILETSAHVMHIMLFTTVFTVSLQYIRNKRKKYLLKNKRKHIFKKRKACPITESRISFTIGSIIDFRMVIKSMVAFRNDIRVKAFEGSYVLSEWIISEKGEHFIHILYIEISVRKDYWLITSYTV